MGSTKGGIVRRVNAAMLVSLAVLVLAGGSEAFAAGFGHAGRHGKHGHHKGQGVTAVEIATARSGSALSQLSLSGTVVPKATLDLSAAGPGRVSSVDVTPGQTLGAGQVVAVVTNPLAGAQVTAAQAAVATAQAKLQAATQAAQANLAKAEDALAAARSVYNDAQAAAQANQQMAVASARVGVAKAQAALAQANATVTQAEASVSQAEADQNDQSSSDTDSNNSDAAALQSAQGNLAVAQANQAAAVAGLSEAQLSLSQAQSPPPSGALAQAQAAVTQAELGVSQAQDALSPTGTAPLTDSVAQAEDQAAIVQTSAGEGTIVAPFAGTVTSVPAVVGQNVGAGSVLAVEQASQLTLQAPLAQQDLALARPGEPVTISVPGAPATLAGDVAGVSVTGNPSSLSFTVTVTPSSEPAWLLAGESASMEVTTQTFSAAVLVPADSVVSFNGTPQVFELQANHTVKLASVEPGITDGTTTMVSGLPAGAKVVAVGQTYLANGARVRVTGTVPVPPSVSGSAVAGLASATLVTPTTTTGAGKKGAGKGGGAGAGGLGVP